MNFKGYIKKYGTKSFNEYPFNDVDASLISFMSYPNWDLYVNSIDSESYNEMAFKDVEDEHIKPLIKNTPMPFSHKALLKLLRKSKRFKDIAVKYAEKKQDVGRKQQYFACTFSIPSVGHLISFRGTDLSVVGWEEDLIMSLDVVSNSQNDALEYVNKVSSLIDGDFYIGGHSKGGNNAIYSAMNVSKTIQDRIIKVYSMDGPGFYKKDYYESVKYKNIENKIFQIIPKDSFVGVMFYTPKEYKIVSSRFLSAFQHDPISWRIRRNGEFFYKKKRTYMSRVRQKALVDWVDKASLETKALTIDAITNFFGGNDKDILYLLRHPNFIRRHLVFWFKKYDKNQKKTILKFASSLVGSYIKCFFFYLKKKNRKTIL